jgi:mono/diheme cytochrome c family protein
MRTFLIALGLIPLTVLSLASSRGAETKAGAGAVARGRQALLGSSFTPPIFSRTAYDEAWKEWGLKKKPADFEQRFRDRYGLHPAPYDNGGLPMGLRPASALLLEGLAVDCLACHGGSILGKSHVGLPNTTFDFQAMLDELPRVTGRSKAGGSFHATQVRGTSEAGALGVFLLSLRDPDLSLRVLKGEKPLDLDLRDDLCEDAPAWWLLKKKKTMYHTGSVDTRSVRALMQFMLSPLNGRATLEKAEPTFRDIRAYLLSLKAPRYPFPIDAKKAAAGKVVFEDTCARCHGTYGKDGTYPNKVVPLKTIGTDPTRYYGISKKFHDHYTAGWFGKKYPSKLTAGYQAPPLDGVWATAPYFHNGSVPTVYHVLNSKARPKVFTRSYHTGKEDYDSQRLGWKITVLEKGPGAEVPAIERRKVYDTTQRGRGNGGHTFGDHLTEKERKAVIEYLKTL